MLNRVFRRAGGTTYLSTLSLLALISFSDAAVCMDRAETVATYPIESYEPNRLGYTWQDDDVPFVDFTVSLKYQLLKAFTERLTCGKGGAGKQTCKSMEHWKGYLAFTGRFGFYVRTRPSDPVIAKNYTPKLFVRYSPESGTSTGLANYIDFAYAHDSNGQTTDGPGKYLFDRRTSERPEFALDEVSRGWDYLQVAGKHTLAQRWSVYGDLKFFLRHGFVQGVPEEYHVWENDPDGRPRHAFQGVMMAAERTWTGVSWGQSWYSLKDPRVMVQYETGYDPAFRFNTFQVELGARVFDFPVAFWFRDGYGHSLARYYKKTQAFGIELRFAE